MKIGPISSLSRLAMARLATLARLARLARHSPCPCPCPCGVSKCMHRVEIGSGRRRRGPRSSESRPAFSSKTVSFLPVSRAERYVSLFVAGSGARFTGKSAINIRFCIPNLPTKLPDGNMIALLFDKDTPMKEKPEKIQKAYEAWVAKQAPAVEGGFSAVFGSLQGAFLGTLMGTMTQGSLAEAQVRIGIGPTETDVRRHATDRLTDCYTRPTDSLFAHCSLARPQGVRRRR